MTFWDWVLIAVIGGVIVAAVLGSVQWVWARRTTVVYATRGPQRRLKSLRLKRKTAKHAELVKQVLDRADELSLPPGQDLPRIVQGSRPALITFHPTGRQFAMYPDFQTYRVAGERGEVNPAKAHFGHVPVPVHHWSDERLRSWLHSHL